MFLVEGVIAVAFFLVLLFNRPLGTRLLLWEGGISPLWALCPIVLLFGHLHLKTIYDNYCDLETRKNKEIAKKRAELTDATPDGEHLHESGRWRESGLIAQDQPPLADDVLFRIIEGTWSKSYPWKGQPYGEVGAN